MVKDDMAAERMAWAPAEVRILGLVRELRELLGTMEGVEVRGTAPEGLALRVWLPGREWVQAKLGAQVTAACARRCEGCVRARKGKEARPRKTRKTRKIIKEEGEGGKAGG